MRVIHVRCDCGAIVEIERRDSPLLDGYFYLEPHYASQGDFDSFGTCFKSGAEWMSEPEVSQDPSTGEWV